MSRNGSGRNVDDGYSARAASYDERSNAAGPAVEACEEAAMEPDFSAGLLADSADAAPAVWREIPAVLVWTLERKG